MREFNFFENIKDFKEVVPGIDSSVTLLSLQPAFERAAMKIKNIITLDIWGQLVLAYAKTIDNDEQTNPTPEETEAIANMQGSLGNLIAYHDVMFKVIAKKQEEQSFFKYELFMIRESYLDNFAIYMDVQLDYFTANPAAFPGWNTSKTYTIRQNLLMKTANEFNEVFPTGASAYFFSLIAPLQLEVIESEIIPRFALNEIPEGFEKTTNRFVAYKTMAKAARLVDYADLPQSLRQKLYVEDGKSKPNESESIAERYAKLFDSEAAGFLNKIDLELSKPADSVTDVPEDDLNKESDQTYVAL